MFLLNTFPLIKSFLSIHLEKFKSIIQIVRGKEMNTLDVYLLHLFNFIAFTYVSFVLRLAIRQLGWQLRKCLRTGIFCLPLQIFL